VTTPVTQTSPNVGLSEVPADATSSFSLKTYDDVYNSYDLTQIETDPVLGRQQSLGLFNWTSADATGTAIFQDTWYAKLFHLTTSGLAVNNPLARVTSGFTHFKADIELTVWTSGNQNCTGCLVIGTRWDRTTTILTPLNIYADPNVTWLSCQSQEKQRIIIPFKSALWNPRNPALMQNYWGTTYFTVRCPMSNATSATPPALNVYIQGRFVNIRLLGPSIKQYQSATTPAPQGKQAWGVVHSTPSARLWFGKPPANIVMNYTKALKKRYQTHQALYRTKDYVLVMSGDPDDLKLTQQHIFKALNDSEDALKYILNQMESNHRRSVKPKPKSPKAIPQSSFKKEAQKVAKTGLNLVKDAIPGSRVALTIAKTLGRFVAPNIVDTLEEWGFDYIVNQAEIQRIRQENIIPFSWKSGVNPSLSMGPTTYDPSEQIDDPMGKNFMSFQEYLSMPSLVRSVAIDTTQATDNVFLSVPICPQYAPSTVYGSAHYITCGPMQWLSNKFKFWRGSMKYRLMIWCPTGVTASIRVTHQPEAFGSGAATFIPSADAGDLISEVVYVTKDMIHEISIPYQGHTPMKACIFNPCLNFGYTNLTTCGTLSISLITKVVNSFNVAANVQVDIYAMSDPDDPLRFYDLKDDDQKVYQSQLTPTSSVPSPDVEIPANTIVQTNGKNANGFTTNQEFTSFKELALSYQDSNIVTDPTILVQPRTLLPEFLKWTFAAYRGNLRLITKGGATYANTLTVKTRTMANTSTVGQSFPLLMTEDPLYKYLEFPYSANVPWRELKNEVVPNDVIQDLPLLLDSVGPIYSAFSDDMQMFFPAFPPLIIMDDSAG
jgi:hypothetical protein